MKLKFASCKILIFALILLAASVIAVPAIALECPQPHMKAAPGVLQETPRAISMRAATLKARGSAAIPSLIFQLRKSHPASSNGEITNYLITAYCPVVNAKPELTDDEKKSMLVRFANQVRRQLP
jgi:hypothetical protein